MKLSVIVPVYGVEKYIARCAKSILEQTNADMEFIFVDDASPDRSIEILEEVLSHYPTQQVTILHHDTNQGLAAARRTGLEAAQGEYIVSVDSDDYIEPNTLELLVGKAEETDADIVGMDCWFEWNNKRSVYRGAFSTDAQTYSRMLLSGSAMPNVWRHMIRRRLYTQTGFYPVPGLNNGEDYVVLPRLCWYANRVAKVDRPLYHYTQTNEGSIVRDVSESNIRQLMQAMEVLTAFFADKPDCAEALHAGQWLKKTDLMMRVRKAYYPLVDTMPSSLPVNTGTMTRMQRVAAFLMVRRWWNLLYIYSRWCQVMIELWHISKGRRKRC